MSATPPSIGSPGSSTRPYLIRALHDWCTDNGFTPYVAVFVDENVRVPMEYVKNNEIVLNVGFEATTGLKLGNEHLEFKARFGGTSRDIFVPIDHVIAIYARENGQGMAFPVPSEAPAGAKPTTLSAVSSVSAVSGSGAPEKNSAGLRLAPDAAEPVDLTSRHSPSHSAPSSSEPPTDTPPPASPGGSRPSLKRIK
jgi:stringent starvation protein B